MDSIGAEVGQKMRSAIKAKLMELDCYVDDELPDYIMVMVANKRTKSQMNEDLQLFLSAKTSAFVEWLHIVLKRLKEVTVTNPEVYKKVAKTKDDSPTSEAKVKKEKKKSKSKKSKRKESPKPVISDLPQKSLTDDLPLNVNKLADKRKVVLSQSSNENVNEDNFDIPLLSQVNLSNESELEDIERKIRSVKSRLGIMVESDSDDADCLNLKPEPDDLLQEKNSKKARMMQLLEEKTAEAEQDAEPKRIEHARITFETETNKKKSVMERLGKRTLVEGDSKSESVSVKRSRINLAEFREEEEKILGFGKNMDEDRKGSEEKRGDLRAWRLRREENETVRGQKNSSEKGILSRLGVMSKVSVPQKEPTTEAEEEEPLHREVPSVIKVKPRVLLPHAKQANKNLLLKAVADAQRSIAQTPAVGTNKIDALYTKKYKTKLAEDKNMSTLKLPEKEKNKIKDIITKVAKVATNYDSDDNLEYTPKPVKRMQQRDLEYIPSSKLRRVATNDAEHKLTINQKFIITLDGIERTNLKNTAKEQTEVKTKRTPSPIIFDKTATLSTVKSKKNIPDKLPIVHPSPSVKNKERCRYWPSCRQGEKCEFVHPALPCKMFPQCKFGDKCLFLHPSCKFETSCTRRDCPYSHLPAGKVVASLTDDNLDEPSYLELEQRLERFRGVIDEFDEAQLAVELAATSDADFEAQCREREQFERNFFGVMAAVKDLMNKNTPGVVATVSSNVQSSAPVNNSVLAGSQGSGPVSSVAASSVILPVSHTAASSPNFQGVKLPTIELPKFDGKYEDWLEYRDTFELLIHCNASINDIQKFHYLRASLAVGAAQVIKSLEFSATNYQVAWSALCNRYDNKKLLLNNHVKALFNIDSIIKESSIQLRKIIDNVNKHLRALESLQQPTSEWDTLIIYLIVSKLDQVSVREWEQQRDDVPKLCDLVEFLKKRANLLEPLDANRSEKRGFKSGESRSLLVTQECCSFCKGDHGIQNCGEFLKLSVNERLEKVKGLKLCVNCLKRGHMSFNCFRKWGSCKRCKGKHHPLLHIGGELMKNEIEVQKSDAAPVNIALSSVNVSSEILLATALIDVVGSDSKCHKARVLLDAGSQSSFITEEFCNVLKLPKESSNMKISGFGESFANLIENCKLSLISRVSNFEIKVTCFITPKITSSLPNFVLDPAQLNIPSNVQLADPKFYVSSKIDILLGADCFWELLCVGQIRCGNGSPILQKTKFGWVLGGPVTTVNNFGSSLCHFVTTDSIDDRLKTFWEIEDSFLKNEWSEEERKCEEHFKKTTERSESGRFVVSFPLKESPFKLGDSRIIAEKRLLSLERKFLRDDNLRQGYVEFMREYQKLGHMKLVEVGEETAYYMPHHAVLKQDSATTKLRVVFNASAPSSTGLSLNQIQRVGPTIQDDIFSILLRFRKHRYVIGADVEKMYRQVLIKPEECSLRRILWREHPSEPIQTFELLTVTYGQTASSYLAIRCLHQCALDVENENQLLSKIIMSNFYVDDFLTGTDSASDAIIIGKGVKNALARGCFNLRKWFSNDPNILAELDSDGTSKSVRMGTKENSKTLGLFWGSHDDKLFYSISESKFHKVTKRTILSDISQIFDPLGLLSPYIITLSQRTCTLTQF